MENDMEKKLWTTLLWLADNQGLIEAPYGKNLEEYLQKRLDLPKSTVDDLLTAWEGKGMIELEKEGFLKRLAKIRIIQKKRGRTVILVDLENIVQSFRRDRKEIIGHEFLSQGFLKIIKQISQEIGEVALVFIFAPPYLIPLWDKVFWERRFFVISCPKIINKENKEQDTTDEILMDLGRKLIGSMDLSHLCLISGDKDFAPLCVEAISRGLRIVTVAASENSLSRELIELSDKVIFFPSQE